MHAQLLQLCLILCNSMDCSATSSSVHGFPRQEYWTKLPFPPPGDPPNPRIKPVSPEAPALQADFFFFKPLRHQ